VCELGVMNTSVCGTIEVRNVEDWEDEEIVQTAFRMEVQV